MKSKGFIIVASIFFLLLTLISSKVYANEEFSENKISESKGETMKQHSPSGQNDNLSQKSIDHETQKIAAWTTIKIILMIVGIVLTIGMLFVGISLLIAA